mgnify:CR=1 FL=1
MMSRVALVMAPTVAGLLLSLLIYAVTERSVSVGSVYNPPRHCQATTDVSRDALRTWRMWCAKPEGHSGAHDFSRHPRLHDEPAAYGMGWRYLPEGERDSRFGVFIDDAGIIQLCVDNYQHGLARFEPIGGVCVPSSRWWARGDALTDGDKRYYVNHPERLLK